MRCFLALPIPEPLLPPLTAVHEAVPEALRQLDEAPALAAGDVPPDSPRAPSTHRGAPADARGRRTTCT